jgi:hypothetical protein
MRILWAVTLDRDGHLFPDELQQLAERLQDAYADASRTQHGPRPPRRCFGNAKEQVGDLLLVVDLMRQLSNRQVARTLHALAYPTDDGTVCPDGLAIPSEARKRGIRAVRRVD